MVQQRSLSPERFRLAWIGSLCQVSIGCPFDAALLLQRFPAPHSARQTRRSPPVALASAPATARSPRRAFPCIASWKGGYAAPGRSSSSPTRASSSISRR